VGEEELKRAKNILISQYELAIQTHSAQALELGLNETYGLGQDFGNKYIKAIKEIDAAEVLQAARKYILPNAYVMVAVGAGLADKEKEPEESTADLPAEVDK
jgi:zinc protease